MKSDIAIFVWLEGDDANSAGVVQATWTQQNGIWYAHDIHTEPFWKGNFVMILVFEQNSTAIVEL